MLRVLHINDYASKGGAEVVMQRTIELQRQRGLEAEAFTIDDVPPHRLTARRYISCPICCAALRDRLASFQPGVVHLHNYYHVLSPGILKTLARHKQRHNVKVVMTAHDYNLACPNPGLRWFTRRDWRLADAERLGSLWYLLTRRWDHRGLGHAWLRTFSFLWHYRLLRRRRVIDQVIAPSRFTAAVIARTGVPVTVIGLPVPGISGREEKPTGLLRMVFVGRIEPEKGLHDLLQQVDAPLPGRLTVVGDGSQREACVAMAASRGLGDAVEFVGHQPRDRTLEIIARSHLLVMPSLTYETAGLVLLEALATGTNILAPSRGAGAEVIADSGVGFTYDPSQKGSLAAAVREAAKAHAAGKLNTFRTEAYLAGRSEEKYIDQIMRVYGA